MELLDRYLQAVRKHLPWKRQDDILAELRANLESQFEDKEAELGRPLTSAETETWLKEIGPPTQMAARYQPQQYLIGPTVFPLYWYVMKLVFCWALAIYIIVRTILLISSPFSWGAVLDAVVQAPLTLMNAAIWVTAIFAALEYAITHYPSSCTALAGSPLDWKPSTLPPLDKHAIPGKKPRSFALAVTELVFGVLFLVWWLLVPQHPYLLLGPGAAYFNIWGPSISPFELAPVWVQFYWWVVALNGIQLAWRCIDLIRGTWQGNRIIQGMIMQALGLIPLLVVLSAPGGVWVVLKHPAQDQLRNGATVNVINGGIRLSLSIVLAIILIHWFWQLAQVLLEAYRKRTAERP